MNKFDRVVSILMLLQTKKVVRAQDLADKFEVSLRTIYRDIRTLEHAGVPISAEAGIGYSLVDGYNLPPVMFTENEATTFLVAEKLVEKFTDDTTNMLFSDAVNKIKAVLKSSEKEKINNLDQHIHVSTFSSQPTDFREERMPVIFNSIDGRQVLRITYTAIYNAKTTERKIEPLGVHFYSGHWHLIAYCRLRKEYRDFRIDRIKSMIPIAEVFVQEHPNLKEYLDDMAKDLDLTEVELLFNSNTVGYARTEKYYHGFVSEQEEEGGVRMHFLSPSLQGMARWLLIFTDAVEIRKPLGLKGIMRGLVEDLNKIYHS